MSVYRQPISETGAIITWCPGCGNFGILQAFKKAVNELGIEPHRVAIVTGIGCHGKLANYINVNSIHTIHGRVLPMMTAIKAVNKDLVVVGFAGDGDQYGIGVGHLPHVVRRNPDVTLIVHNNTVYGLTTGQASPTTERGQVTRTTPWGQWEEPINPIAMMVALRASFVARGFAGDVEHLKYIIKEAIKHKGFSFIDVLQPCVTFDKLHTYTWYRQRIYKLEETGHDPTNWEEAMKKAYEWGDRIPIGIIYKEEKPTMEELLEPIKKNPPLAYLPLQPKPIKDLMEKLVSLTK
ncbi:pyruvate ferredoxin/flavodoxin oxidoreductase, beta subunit [Staphylothermus marinus F1]|uniref:2-oxoacid oxidoreductase (ferredoxin) n=1 Tax=Staphylothermus marinus (strain ATCC 43588 / DSM 3639 / JCM 9404 / F1) TaxID=399550 RepID=A3DPH3_STAMF|nr:thiamine pyrophosphate-dependent enzyme [Staphylothermus marinus]ABN70533.1 pyruvate ferredoxin/flavodoxin oxidoreductase, beta subunit [Staphylothermus marinus F1]